jgi:hypothetical protein
MNRFNQRGPRFHNKNDKTLMKETEEETRKWKDKLCSWNERIKIAKMRAGM